MTEKQIIERLMLNIMEDDDCVIHADTFEFITQLKNKGYKIYRPEYDRTPEEVKEVDELLKMNP